MFGKKLEHTLQKRADKSMPDIVAAIGATPDAVLGGQYKVAGYSEMKQFVKNIAHAATTGAVKGALELSTYRVSGVKTAPTVWYVFTAGDLQVLDAGTGYNGPVGDTVLRLPRVSLQATATGNLFTNSAQVTLRETGDTVFVANFGVAKELRDQFVTIING